MGLGLVSPKAPTSFSKTGEPGSNFRCLYQSYIFLKENSREEAALFFEYRRRQAKLPFGGCRRRPGSPESKSNHSSQGRAGCVQDHIREAAGAGEKQSLMPFIQQGY